MRRINSNQQAALVLQTQDSSAAQVGDLDEISRRLNTEFEIAHKTIKRDMQNFKKVISTMEAQHRAEMDAQKEALKTLKNQLLKSERQCIRLMDEKRNKFRLEISAYDWNYSD
jgi:hypothetical protein